MFATVRVSRKPILNRTYSAPRTTLGDTKPGKTRPVNQPASRCRLEPLLVIHCIVNYPVLRAPQVGERRFSLDVRGVAAATVSGMETCEDCGFAWVQVGRDEIASRSIAAAQQIANVIVANADRSRIRPTPERWSALEYAAHVRDVFLTIRDRLVIGLVEDEPGFKPLYRDQRINLGLYASDTVTDVAGELVVAANMLARLFDEIEPQLLDRIVQYGFPDPLPRTLLWMGQQAVHESEHHLADITENLGAR